MTRIILVGCAKTKRTAPAPARDLYDPSQLFIARRAYAEASGAPWAILSARYAVIDPDRMIRPYDETIAQRLRDTPGGPVMLGVWWAQTCMRIAGRESSHDGNYAPGPPLTIEIHAGVDYVKCLRAAIEGEWGREVSERVPLAVAHPVAGLGIGRQKRWYADRRRPVQLGLFEAA